MDISKIKVGSTSYDVKDAVARTVMGASGENHASGLVPDPGATAGTSKFLCEDGTWKEMHDAYATIRVNLQEYLNNALANGSGLTGIVVSIQNTTDNTPAVTKTYAGDELAFDGLIPVKAYRVSVLSRTGYKLDYAYQDISILDVGGDVTKTFKYEAYEYTTTMTSSKDSGTMDSRIDRTSTGVYLIAQYTYGGETITSTQKHYGDKVLVPVDADLSTLTISSSSDVETFNKTESVDNINRLLLVAYQRLATLTGFFTIDQTGSSIIIKDENNNTSYNYVTPNIINEIRSMSHCFTSLYDSGRSVLKLKQLDDLTVNKYVDGTDSTQDIRNYNVFMRLPYFFVKIVIVSDVIRIDFWIDLEQGVTTTSPEGEGWIQCGGNELIGRYKCKKDVSKSVSGASNYQSQGVSAYCSVSGPGLTNVNGKMHSLMGILFMGYYGTVDWYKKVGYGYYGTTTTGAKDSYGMRDNGNTSKVSASLVFWGLEDWWGGGQEYMANFYTTVSSSAYIGKMGYAANYLLYPKSTVSSSSSGYKGAITIDNNSYFYQRSLSFITSASEQGGIFAIRRTGTNTSSVNYLTRIQYNGDIEFVSSLT